MEGKIFLKIKYIFKKKTYGYSMHLSDLEDLSVTCLEEQIQFLRTFLSTEQRNHDNYFSKFKCIITYSILK